MKNIFLLLVFVPIICFGQKSQLNYYADYNLGSGYSNFGIPFFLHCELGPFWEKKTQRLSGGFEFSYRQFKEPYNSTFSKHHYIGFLPDLNFHFLAVDSKHDLYGGLSDGFLQMSPVAHDTINYPASSFLFGAQIGYHYFFTTTIGFNFEFKAGEIHHYKNTIFYEAFAGMTLRLIPKK